MFQVIFKKKNSGEPIAILDLVVASRQNIISNSFRFYHEAETTLSRIILITGYKSIFRSNLSITLSQVRKAKNRSIWSCSPKTLFQVVCSPFAVQILLYSSQSRITTMALSTYILQYFCNSKNFSFQLLYYPESNQILIVSYW